MYPHFVPLAVVPRWEEVSNYQGRLTESHPTGHNNNNIIIITINNNNNNSNQQQQQQQLSFCQRKMQLIYDELPLSHSLLSADSITLKERLGGGNFGYVVKGLYRTPGGQEVPVAVKTLKPNQITNAGEREILAEARTMAQLKHRHIVRLIGKWNQLNWCN
ncbi:Tyrosine-protein kinase [Fasciola gigantica]|uniref:Tyrosine-protein kinase n=1 Tax=Fasciola gigantica TaxID=46835 RepID=A0A504YLX2_FASGI|nr:Tyrosine-protein kinase [Fasciola gigantica]